MEDVDVEVSSNLKRRKLIHQSCRRVSGRVAADQELINDLSNELEMAMRELQESNVALDNCQQSKREISRLQVVSRGQRTELARRQRDRIEEQDRILQATTARLEERERMVRDLSELNDMNQLLITRYQEHEDREADLDDEENSRSSRDRRRYTDQIERLEQQLGALCSEYEVAGAELHRLRRDRDGFHDETKAAEADLQQQQGEVTQREGVVTRLNDRVDKMRGDSVNHELRGQRTALRKEVQELRATLKDRDSRLEELRVML